MRANEALCVTGQQALAVGQQHDLEHDARLLGAVARFIILELGIQGVKVEFVVYQIVQRESKAAGDDLLRSNHGQQQAVVVLGFGAGPICFPSEGASNTTV